MLAVNAPPTLSNRINAFRIVRGASAKSGASRQQMAGSNGRCCDSCVGLQGRHLRAFMRLTVLLCFLAGALAAIMPLPAQAQNDPAAGPRFALLIGNANYPDAGAPLPQPPKNVRAMADELRRSGFDVDMKENLGRDDMQRAIEAFKQKIRPGSTALVFFSGYGLQVNRQTFILPVNAQVWTENDITRQGIGIESLLDDMQGRGARIKLLIIDASRRNPYERRFRAAATGLAPITAPTGTLIISAAAPGKAIEDEGANSLFIGELAKEMRTPGLTAEEIFSRARIGVSRASNGEQVPWVSSSLADEFYFIQPASRVGIGPPVDARPPARTQAEPQVTPSPPPAQPPRPAQPQATTPRREAVGQPRSEPAATGAKAGDVFRDCAECPEMVVVPTGEFDMGSAELEYEKPVHRVAITKPFAIGRREVTFEEWDQCVAAGSCFRADDRGLGRGERPVTDVSWRDVQTYIGWLSQKTGKKYRLPSEAEWEYAARGGTKTTFWWGRDVGNRFANCRDCGGSSQPQAITTGTFAANPFGLFDTAGNAAEWVEDCWNDTYRGAPKDGSAWTSGQCGLRGLRGGSFDSQARYVRSAARFRYDADVRYYANGFRVARDLP
ncbi:MAG: SUMF1/EgtB/PvdO family nonheme iron enzyme [Xanthobacteraceae bacterium]